MLLPLVVFSPAIAPNFMAGKVYINSFGWLLDWFLAVDLSILGIRYDGDGMVSSLKFAPDN